MRNPKLETYFVTLLGIPMRGYENFLTGSFLTGSIELGIPMRGYEL